VLIDVVTFLARVPGVHRSTSHSAGSPGGGFVADVGDLAGQMALVQQGAGLTGVVAGVQTDGDAGGVGDALDARTPPGRAAGRLPVSLDKRS
jgi:hypothetical protein